MGLAATMRRASALAGTGFAAILLSGCVSFGAEPPDRLLTLTSSAMAPVGQDSSGTMADALAVLEPETPQRLAVPRVPVQVDDANVAYLKDAVWVERPSRLFGKLLAETIRADGKRFVVDGPDLQFAAKTKLSGQLLELGYDVPTQSVIVRFDAVLQDADGTIRTRRFEAEVDGVEAEAEMVGPALNEAANQVAAEVAEWIG